MRYTAPLTPDQAEQLGKDVDMIVAFAARALNRTHGVNIDRLMKSFTSSNALKVSTGRYLKAREEGHRPGEAAGRAGTALVLDWADAVLEAHGTPQPDTLSAPATETAQ